MAYGSIPLEKRLKDNIKNYSLKSLLDLSLLSSQANSLYQLFRIELLITDRHGEKIIVCGDFTSYQPDVVKEPGIKLRIADRTVAHVYVRYEQVEKEQLLAVQALVDGFIKTAQELGEKTYLYKETATYTDELEEKLEKESYQVKHGEKNDELTGVLNRTYFENRLKIVDRSQIAPVCAICVNINDWKYANDHFGEEGSDRLIKIVADILQEKAKPEYIIGRVDGDVFNVLIPMPEEGESDTYCSAVKEACDRYEDAQLAPSVAIGSAMKENVEESLTDVLSNAEYEMFEDKLTIKNAPEYKKRLQKGC